MIREILMDMSDDIIFLEGFDLALIGHVERAVGVTVALYDKDKCVEILMGSGLSYIEALEYFDFNILGAYIGEYTPAFATLP